MLWQTEKLLIIFRLMETNDTKPNPFKSHFFIIGLLMLIGGLGQMFVLFQNDPDPKLGSIIIHSITTLGGIAFLSVAFKYKR